jgi:hypothetical protein
LNADLRLKDSDVVSENFGLPSPYTNRPLPKQTGDGARQNGLPDIEYLLNNAVCKPTSRRATLNHVVAMWPDLCFYRACFTIETYANHFLFVGQGGIHFR